MIFFVQIATVFFVGSLLGWVVELFFRRIVHKKWINPGFLAGPCLPLYGTGVLTLYLVCSIDYSFIENDALRYAFVILLITFLMTLIEYITGLVFIKGMKVKLWDYSDRKGNIQGIICPLFTLFWGLAGAAYYIGVHPFVVNLVQFVALRPEFSFFTGACFGVFVLDLCYSFRVVGRIRKWASDHDVVVKMEEFRLSVRLRAEKFKQKHHFIFSLRGRNGVENELDSYLGEKTPDAGKKKRAKRG